jgi:hypothetical protein
LKLAYLVVAAALIAVASIGCGIFDEDDDEASNVRVRSAALGSVVNDQGQIVTPTLAFAISVPQINAVLVLEGVSAGDRVVGRWYQLGVADAGAEGKEINSATITLSEAQIQEGLARVTFTQRSGGQFPVDAWVFRIFVNGKLVRTMGFVTLQAQSGTQTQPSGQQTPTQAQPQATATPAFENYTVVAGDTLNGIAQRFRPANEDVNAFMNRILQANNLQPNATLQTGQVLRIPR